jgi:AraC-like DNA-binding protein
MELLQDHHVGEKMLGHLHQILIEDYPEIIPGELALHCDLPSVSWWKAGSPQPLQNFIDLLRYLAEKSAPEVSYTIAKKAHLTDLGMMGYAMMTAETLEDFILVAGYSLEQFNFPFQVSLQMEADGVLALGFSARPNDSNCFDSYLELTMALAWHYIEVIIPAEKKLIPNKVCLTFSKKPKHHRVIGEYYKSEIEYESKFNAILFPANAVQTRLSVGSLADIVACSLQCSQILGNTKARGRHHRMVERALIEAPHICKFSFSETAKYLGVKERSLRNYLELENTQFRSISLNVRMKLAQEYLKSTNFPVKHVAYMLSYTEPNNFIRAFKKHTGLSPTLFRNASA